MEYEAIINFLDKTVKLEYHNGFNLHGIIKKLYNETILFETEQTTSLINLSDIKNIVLVRGEKL
jgi:hypothetical protein